MIVLDQEKILSQQSTVTSSLLTREKCERMKAEEGEKQRMEKREMPTITPTPHLKELMDGTKERKEDQ